MHGGHFNVCVLAAFRASAGSDLAKWHTDASDAIAAVGNAMDLTIGAKRTLVMIEPCTAAGGSKIAPKFSQPLVGTAGVRHV
jgi:acyl CoA:acetate/3-ketoacid CoA transferase beta subunit